jgi:thiamine pyrophosphokinase
MNGTGSTFPNIVDNRGVIKQNKMKGRQKGNKVIANMGHKQKENQHGIVPKKSSSIFIIILVILSSKATKSLNNPKWNTPGCHLKVESHFLYSNFVNSTTFQKSLFKKLLAHHE